MPQKLPNNFVNERYCKDEKYIVVYDSYTPNYKKTNVTAKFYSKYEADVEEVDSKLLNNLIRAQDFGPKLKLAWPETSNQKYGWFVEPVSLLDRTDTRLYIPRVQTELTKHGLKMLQIKNKK